ncbi:MAG: hypothetical protein HC874_14300 [Richelia sp. SL_2_1]|nr:hypothetical protein [Richelia sp. SL_2_1]
MVLFTVKGVEGTFAYPEKLSDHTFGKFLGYLEELVPKEPLRLRQIKNAYIEEEEIDLALKAFEGRTIVSANKQAEFEELTKKKAAIISQRLEWLTSIDQVYYTHEMLPHFARVVSFFTGLPYAAIMGMMPGIQGMNPHQLEAVYEIIIRSMDVQEYQYDYENKFVFEGDVYVVPERLMKNGNVIEFMESAQLQAQMQKVQNGTWTAMLDVCCVLLKKEGEVYSSNIYKRNKANFERLPLDVVVNVAFFLLRRSEQLGRSSLIYSMAQMLALSKPGSTNYKKTTGGS